ncbi:hypothetical protein GCM10023310_10890 [Paenibacillus vulneris]
MSGNALQQVIGLVDFALDLFGILLGQQLMIPRMIAEHMALLQNPIDHLRVLARVVPDQEEGGVDLVLFQNIQYPRRILGVGAIIKC